MAAEVYALFHVLDHAYTVRETLEGLSGCQIPLETFADSRSLFNVIAKDNGTVKGRLRIDVCSLRDGYCKGELKCIQ